MEVSDGLNKKGLKIVHITARSVLNKLAEIELTLRGFDVIFISETWLTEPLGVLAIPGYNFVRQNNVSIKWSWIPLLSSRKTLKHFILS